MSRTIKVGIDLRQADTLEEHGDGFANSLNFARPGAALRETEEFLGKSNTKLILELQIEKKNVSWCFVTLAYSPVGGDKPCLVHRRRVCRVHLRWR